MQRCFSLVITFCLMIAISSYGQGKPKDKKPSDNKPGVSINHTAVFVVSCKVSTDFYMNIVGLDSIPEPFHDGKHKWLKTGPKSALHIIEGSTEKKEYYKNTHTCYTVPSVEAFAAKLRKNKFEYEDVAGKKNSITTRVDGVKQLWFRDPDGYWLEINDAKE